MRCSALRGGWHVAHSPGSPAYPSPKIQELLTLEERATRALGVLGVLSPQSADGAQEFRGQPAELDALGGVGVEVVG